jgi:uncharacterized membrane protein
MGTNEWTGGRTAERRLAAMLCYLLGIASGVILLRVERQDRFVRFHALQSILYTTVAVAAVGALIIVGLGLAATLLWLASAALWLYLIYRAARGDWYQLPGLGWLAERSA